MLFYLCHRYTLEFCNLFCDVLGQVWVQWTMTDCCNLCLMVTSNTLWHAHVFPIYWIFFHLKLQVFTLSDILKIIYYWHLTLFYLWCHCMLGSGNLFYDAMWQLWIGWTMANGCNICLIIPSNALWCTHVLPIYWTFCHFKFERFIFNGTMQIICYCHLALFYLWHHCSRGFVTFFKMSHVLRLD